MIRTLPHLLRATRLLTGARSRSRLALAAAALVMLAAPAGARRAEEARPLPWRAGGRVGLTVDAAAFPESTGTMLEVYVRIPPATLESMTRDSLGVGRLALTTRLRLPTGGRLPESRQELAFGPGETAPGFGKVVVLRYPTRPGPHRLAVRLEDANSRKPGLPGVSGPRRESTALEDEFEVPRPQDGREISDLEFVWAQPDSGTGLFQRAGQTRLPNPERLYGLFASDLRAFFVARGRDGDARPWRWVARVLDGDGKAQVAQESTGTAGAWLSGECTLDVSTLPAGGYDLELKAWQEGDPEALVRRARFSVAWQAASWKRNPLEIEDEVHFLFDAELEERFATLQPGEQERMLDDFWARRDPSPGTAVNEARETFLRRVDQANQLYSRRGLQRGMFSDMGRVYIRYGEPSEVSRQVIPAGAETVLQALAEIESSETRPTGDVHQKGIGGDQRPFEVWVYEAPVAPPIDADPEVRGLQRHKRLVFLFVDQHMLGNFTLRYSTE